MYARIVRALAALCVVTALSMPVLGVQATATVAGRVVDATGAAIEGARVTLRHKSTGTNYVATSDAAGEFSLSGLPSGAYRWRVEREGFVDDERELALAAGEALSPDVALLPRGVTEQVTVTATRSVESVANVPGAVTVVGGEQLLDQARLTNNVQEVLGKLVPGLAAPNQSPSNFAQTLRGRNALVLIDGVPQSTTRNTSRNLTTIDPSVIERVEVVRGATAVYGDGATGGVINIITKRPERGPVRFTTDVGTNMSLSHPGDSVGATIRQTVTGSVRAVDYLFGGSFDRTGGFFDAEGDRIPPDPHGQGGLADTNTGDLLAKLRFNLTPKQYVHLTASYFRALQDTDYTFDPTVNAATAREVKARALAGLDLDRGQESENFVFDVGYTNEDLFGSRLRSQLYHRNYLTSFFPFDARTFPTLGSIIFQSRLESEKTGGRLDLETRLPEATALTLHWGLDYSSEDTSQPVGVIDPDLYEESGGRVFRTIGDRVWVPPVDQNNLGLFAQLEWRGAERLTVRGGLRHERIEANVASFTTLAGASIPGADLDYSDTLFNVGAVFYPTSSLSVYGAFTQGFSAPDIGLILRGAPAGASVDTLPFAAQKVDNYEVGVRTAWQRVQTSLAGYYNTSDLGTSSGGFNQPVVRAPERVYGMEATLDVQPADRWRLGATATWLEGESDVDLDGDYRYLNSYRIPPVKVTGYVEHDTLERWTNRFQVLYSGGRDRFGSSIAFGERDVRSYATVDWLSQIRLPRGSLRLGVENLFNNQYFTKESQLLRSGRNDSYAAARGAVLSVGYTIEY
jgi:iron complex outermembrane receptor protein